MDEKELAKRISKKDFNNLENELLESFRNTRDLKYKYFLGICYSEQYTRYDEAVTIFKELMNTDFKQPYMYLFVAKRAKTNIESCKIIKEGIKNFNTNKSLKSELLFYLEGEKKEKYFKQLKNEIKLTFSLTIEMVSYFYEKQNFQKALELIKRINIENSPNKTDIQFLNIVVRYLSKEKIDSDTIDNFTVSDDNSFLGMIVRLIEIDTEDNSDKAKELIQQLTYMPELDNPFLEIINFSNSHHSYFLIDKLFYSLLDKLIEKQTDENSKRKIELIGIFQKLVWEDEEKPITRTELREFLKIINEEIKENNDKSLYLNLMDIYHRLGNNKKYFDTYIKALDNFKDIEYINLSNFNVSELEYAKNHVINTIKIYDFNSNRYQYLIENLVEELHKNQKYSDIVKLMDAIDYKKLDYIKFGFEIAYAFNKNDRTDLAKEIYENYITVYPNSDAAINNLGVIYKKEKNYEKALECYIRAESISHNDIYSNNITSCKELIEQLDKEKELENKALEFFKEENIWIIDRIKSFYEEADENGNVICPYKKLPIIFKCHEGKSQDVLKQMLEKGYLFRNKNHNYDTTASVYKINYSIKNRIQEIEKEYMLINSLTNNLNDFTIENLANIEYNKIIIKLGSIKQKNIRNIFIRDYNELVFNYLTNQQKTVVLMSGTLVELLLLFILNKKKIVKYKVGSKQRDKKITEMDITEMLEVCDKEKFVQNTPKKFMDGLKNFRNFIHPGKELREKNLELDKSTVELSFNIVNWLILNIDLK
ncbi:MAG: tetratricopeptide repeat protein [Bacilli bacterium]|nr:tetratricopeptide repeat protein [Bacilli bacterium]